MSDHEGWQEHDHEALAHSHRHYHVTHNFSDMAGTFQHLSSEHEHKHDHAALKHSHWPHENFDTEHQGEAHVHDHEKAVRPETAKKAAATKSTSKAAGPRKAAAPTGGGNGEGAPAKTSRPARKASKTTS